MIQELFYITVGLLNLSIGTRNLVIFCNDKQTTLLSAILILSGAILILVSILNLLLND